MDRPYAKYSSDEIVSTCKKFLHDKKTLLELQDELSHRSERFSRGASMCLDVAIEFHQRMYVQQATSSTGTMTLREAYTLFNADHTTPFEEIVLARRRLIQQYHPDKVASLGQKLKETAENEVKLINLAYAIVKQAHGMH